MSADAFPDWIYQWLGRGKRNLSYGAPNIVRINTVLRIVFNQALFTSARCIWNSTNYATKGTISPPRKKNPLIITIISPRYRNFPLTSLQIKSFLVFLMTAVQNGGTKPFDGVKNNLMEVCPALPHKKRGRVRLQPPQSESGQNFTHKFPWGESGSERSETQGREQIFFFKDVTSKRPKVIIKWTEYFGFYFTSSLFIESPNNLLTR